MCYKDEKEAGYNVLEGGGRRLDTMCYKDEKEAGYNVLEGGEGGWIQRARRRWKEA